MKDDDAIVPTTALTVTTLYPTLSELRVPNMHATAVPDVHDVVLHAFDASTAAALGVKLYAPKFSPEIVTAAPLLVTAFPATI